MSPPDAPDSDQEPTLIEVPTERVDARITMDDLAARLKGKSGAAADLARRLAEEIGPVS
jgi:hypothetical protein